MPDETEKGVRAFLLGLRNHPEYEKDADMALSYMSDLEAASYRDSLTGLWNVRAFNERVESEFERVNRYNRAHPDRPDALSLLAADIDDFKGTNDTYGHPFGDIVLVYFARLLETERASDSTCRIHGDEFNVVLPATDFRGAITIAEQKIEAVRNFDIMGNLEHDRDSGVGNGIPKDAARNALEDLAGKPRPSLNISVGLSVYPFGDHVKSPMDLVRYADRALYKAKKDGKNMVRSITDLELV